MSEKSELTLACEVNEITASAVHVRFESDPEWMHDLWSVTLSYRGRSIIVEFKTGVGHRVLSLYPRVKRERGGYYQYEGSGRFARTDAEAVVLGMLVLPKDAHNKVMGPSAADVLYCLLSDADACETSFEDWASNFGYDADSIKAQKTYFACQKSGDKLRKLLGSTDLLTELRGKEH